MAAAAVLLAGLIATGLAGPPTAAADVGVESVSRSAGVPGDRVLVTLGCGFCYPPCVGPKGERHPAGFDEGPCMLGTEGKAPPASFGISLVPLAKAPRPRACGRGSACPPRAAAPPRRAPFRFLGLATPPPGGNDPAEGVPRYLLRFELPDVRPGRHAFVIYCDACQPGAGGGLIVETEPRIRVIDRSARTVPGSYRLSRRRPG